MSWNDTERKPDIDFLRANFTAMKNGHILSGETEKKMSETFERIITSYDDEIENLGYQMMGDDL